ncbi:polyprenol reductase 1 [Selaginella moellendorffii]|uniref:polyprenol reductase 1 n=1 Tax=Selaginella moellendorffii TaxID=88036 RepID=UPI000D1CE7F9|nr:polyprenol reductase 1 [Selaginella moellendorffii]XP_024518022.1 polyprenol reductase 1 [Selaginella moellendorffii]|eukprot:XP_024518021.1 polyprenol reductase 1 [Selaginella moellendorffii]
MALLFFEEYAANSYLYAVLVIGLASLLPMGLLELKGGGLRYSKFAEGKSPLGEIPSRIAMFLFYFPSAALAGAVLSATMGILPSLAPEFLKNTHPSPRFLVLTAAICIHFSKRVIEVLFVHKYSGNAELLSSLSIVFFYTASTANLLYAQQVAEDLAPPKIDLMFLGCVFFVVGIVGNFYHHDLLAQLRSGRSPQQPRYVVPHGGLFDLVACPHYLFEIIDFIGLGMISQTAISAATVMLVAFYLTSRSISTRRWYLKKVDGFPRQRKALIPFVL